jgi:DNA-directed RNA polymerase subunit L
MSKNIDINVDKIQFTKNDYSETKLILNIYGKNVNNFILNSLRKACIDQVPVYAFHESGIKILRDSSVYDPTELKMCLPALPIFNLDYDIKFIPQSFYDNIEEFPEDNKNIEYYVKSKNEEYGTIKTVTTNDILISIDDERIKNETMYDKECPIEFCKLRYNDEIEFSMKAKLGVGEMNGIYNASHTWFNDLNQEPEELEIINEIIKKNNKEKTSSNKNKQEDKTNNFTLMIESSGQLHELELLKRAIGLIIIKTKSIKEDIKIKYTAGEIDDCKEIFDFGNEDFTCMGQINYLLQEDPDVIFSGASKPNLLEKRINLLLTVKEGKSMYEILNRNIEKSIECYEHLLKKVNDII